MTHHIFKSLAALALGATLLVGCGKEQNVTITQGIYGTVVERWGDWMPGGSADHGETPIANAIYVYEYTKFSDFDSNYNSKFSIDCMPRPLVATATSGADGFYEFQLASGTYSVFLLNDGKLVGGGGLDGYGGISPVTVDPGAVVEMNLVIDHAVY